MKFSVVIPLFNKQAHIRETLASALGQSFDDFEVIVVDDGSTDESLAIASSISSEKLTVLAQHNQGVSVARNTGIGHAKGQFIAFLDADDVWHSDYLKTVDYLTRKFPESDLFVTAYRILLNGNVRYSKKGRQLNGCLDSYWETLGEKYDFVWTSACTVRREALLAAGGFRVGERIGQDLDMWARVAKKNPKVAFASQYCVDYRRDAEQNARTRVKIAYPEAFLHDLREELENGERTAKEREAIQSKYNWKMTAYIFTCILAGEKARAGRELENWKTGGGVKISLVKAGLRLAGWMPRGINRWVYGVRLRIF